jgi:hypothetical protein
MNWEPTDFMACLGVEPVVEENEISFSYQVTKDGLRLELIVFQYDGDIYITVYRDGLDSPVVDCRLVDCDAARRVSDQRGEYLEFAPGALFNDRYDGKSVIPYGVHVRVEPSIGVEFFKAG